MGLTVLGDGAAGAMAALSARRAGVDVELRVRAWGATALSSGALDLAGDPHEGPGDAWLGRPSVERNIEEMTRRNPRHPLGKLRAAVEPALQLFCQHVPLYRPRPLSVPNLVLPTDLGTWKSTFLAQRTQAAADLNALGGRSIAVVGLRGWPLFRPGFVAASLAELARRGGVDLEMVPCAGRWPDDDVALREPHELARALDAPAAAERLGEALAPLVRRRDLALLPPILGLLDGDVADRASQAAGVRVLETLASELSVPGLRLQMSLHRALDGAGIRRSASADLPADPVVLATGRFLGGGIVGRGEGYFDAVFDVEAPITASIAGRSGRFGADVAGPQPFMSAGLATDDRLRPMTGRPKLFAAGAVLGGYDPVHERCGLGTAIVTGVAAGAWAAEVA